MNCSVIFYMAHKTSYCETSLNNVLKANDIKVEYIYPAFSPEMLAEAVNSSSENTDIIFILGGLSKTGYNNTISVLSKGFNDLDPKPNVYEIKNNVKGDNGFILNYQNQNIIVLPDDPEQIVSMISKNLIGLLIER